MDNGLTMYAPFIKEIKELIYRHQYEAMKKVNIELMLLYWEIGEEICNKQREQGWGKSVVEILAKELQKEFPGIRGFSTTNLWLMRQFYIEHTTNPIFKPLVSVSLDAKLQPMAGESQKQYLPPLVGDINALPDVIIYIDDEFFGDFLGLAKKYTINNMSKVGASLSLIFYQKNFKKNSPALEDFQPPIFGLCGNSILSIQQTQF